MSGYGLHRKIFPLPSPTPFPPLTPNLQPNVQYPTTTAKSSSTHHTQTQSHPQPAPAPAPAPNTSWPPFCDGIDLPPPYLTEKDCIPYHETGKYCPHCICFVRDQGRERGHGGGMYEQGRRRSMLEMDVDLDGDGDIEMCISAGFKKLREADMSCNRRNNAVVDEIGIGGNGKRRMDMDMDMRDENASPMKRVRYV